MKGCRPGQHIVLPPNIRITTIPTTTTTTTTTTATTAGTTSHDAGSTESGAKAGADKGTRASPADFSLARWAHYALPTKEEVLDEIELLMQLAKDPSPSQVEWSASLYNTPYQHTLSTYPPYQPPILTNPIQSTHPINPTY